MGEKLNNRIASWKKLLLDFSKHNRLINFKPGKRNCVTIEQPEMAELYQHLAIEEKPIVFPFAQDISYNEQGEETYRHLIPGNVTVKGALGELRKTLKNLRYRANTSQTEQGVNILFMTFGLMDYTEKDSQTRLQAPLILVPVRLQIASPSSPYELVMDEEDPILNPTLVQKLENDYGLQPPLFDADNESIDEYFTSMEKVIEPFGWNISREMNLTLLSFLKMNMYKDLERNGERLAEHPIIAAMSGEADPPTIPEGLDHYDHDKLTRPIDTYQVVDADSSQQDAILLSKKGVSFVLQGPPGTGKSQTITNIIAEAMADGKKVLFVSEKMAALRVVHNRLAAVGLADFCFTLHSHKASKKAILSELDASLKMDRRRVRGDVLEKLDDLERKRAELNDYARELHLPVSGIGMTAYEANGKLSGLEKAPDLIFPIQDVYTLSAEALRRRIYLLGELSKVIGKQKEDVADNVWNGAKVEYLSNELRHDIDHYLPEAAEAVSAVDNCIVNAGIKLGLTMSVTFPVARAYAELLEQAGKCKGLPASWAERNDLPELLERINRLGNSQRRLILEKGEIYSLYEENWSELEAERLLEELEKHLAGLQKYVAIDVNVNGLSTLKGIYHRLYSDQTEIEAMVRTAKEVAQNLGIQQPDCPDEYTKIYRLCSTLQKIQSITPRPFWFRQAELEYALNRMDEARELHDRVRQMKADILTRYDKEILQLDFMPILQRFRTGYSSFFRIFNGQYREDMHTLGALRNDGNRLNYEDATSLLEQLKTLQDLNKEILDRQGEWADLFGAYYEGKATNWQKLSSDLILFGELIRQIKPVNENLQRLLVEKKVDFSLMERFLKGGNAERMQTLVNELKDMLALPVSGIFPLAKLAGSLSDLCNTISCIMEIDGTVKEYRKQRHADTDLAGELRKIAEYRQTKAAFTEEHTQLADSIGSWYNGEETDFGTVADNLMYAINLRKTVGRLGLSPLFVHRVFTEKETVAYCKKAHKELAMLIAKAEQPLHWFLNLFEDPALFDKIALEALAARILSCKDHKYQLEEWVDYCINRTRCEQAGLQGYLEQLDTTPLPADRIVPAYLKRFYHLWLDAAMDELPAVRDFRSRVHTNKIEEFCKLDTGQLRIAQARVRERVISRLPDFSSITSTRDEIGILKREINKKSRLMPLRRLFMSIPNLITALRPCFMMSPLSVSVFLEAQSYEFDMVIFDEASQVHTEDAIGAIMRGKQVIIVGDTKQMPPTNFFAATVAGDEDYDATDDTDMDLETGSYESILDEAVTVLPERSLRWHYRSRHEHLIAFSNLRIYNRSLITFPSATTGIPDTGVQYIHVADGVYDRGGKKDNPVEAARVAELVFEHFRKYPERSLGVVAFSEAQMHAIDEAIINGRNAHPEYEEFFNEEREEPFFVKNLENVQGDERDTVIFSIGYAKDKNGMMYMNFGPLGREGGYRRLNVAITRAKHNVKLVGSILGTDIDPERAKAEGVRMLRDYILFAQNGIASLTVDAPAEKVYDGDTDFATQVHDFLAANGYQVENNVGCSDYRIGMAVLHPSKPGCYAISIEVDGPEYLAVRTARERDRLRGTVLNSMGWELYRIWSTDWAKDPVTEGERLLAAVAAATEVTPPEPEEEGKADEGDATAEPAGEEPVEEESGLAEDAFPELAEDLVPETVEEEPDEPDEETATVPDPMEHTREEEQVPEQDEPGQPDYEDITEEMPAEAYAEELQDGFEAYESYPLEGNELLDTQLLIRIVALEGPLHIDELYHKVLPLTLFQKITPSFKNRVEALLGTQQAQEGIFRAGKYLIPTDIDMETCIPRYPAEGTDPRPIEHIHTEELAAGMIGMVRSSIGITVEDLMKATARRFGYKRLTEGMERVLQAVYNMLIQRAQLEELEGKVRCTE